MGFKTIVGDSLTNLANDFTNKAQEVIDFDEGSEDDTSNPYAAKVASVQKLYDVGEANLTADDIVTVNGVDCYVLQVDGNKAELITKGIYFQSFGGFENYKYHESPLKTWMDNFYTDYLGENECILESNVISYYTTDELSVWKPDDVVLFEKMNSSNIKQYVFALDAKEAQTNASKFKFNSNYIGRPFSADGFWTSAAHYSSMYDKGYALAVRKDSTFTTILVNGQAGARPAFWISLD